MKLMIHLLAFISLGLSTFHLQGAPMRIVCIGDSITQGRGDHSNGGAKWTATYSYRYPLWKLLVDAGAEVEFVGSLKGGFEGDPDWADYKGKSFARSHEGHWGWKTVDVAAKLPGWMEGYTPDMALILLGSNDANGKTAEEKKASVERVRAAMTDIIATLRKKNPKVVVLLGQCFQEWEPFPAMRAAMTELAKAQATAESPIVTVDHSPGWVSDPKKPGTHTVDWVHPNPAGDEKIARNFMAAMQPYLKSGKQANAGSSGAGLRVMHVGNSHSHALRFLEPLAWAVGHQEHRNGEINILGAPLRWNWDHPEQNKWQVTLDTSNKWDAITLLAWADDDAVYAPKFAAEAFKSNPKCQVYIYTIWPDTYMDWEKPSPIRTESHTEKVAAAVEKAFPDAPKPRVVPSSLLLRELGRLADAGQLPGVANRFALFSDGGHLSEPGMYGVAAMVCAMLYGESPLGYPSSYARTDGNGKPIRGWYENLDIAKETAEVIKRTAWEILLTYPPAGMSRNLIIADRHLPPAIVNQPFQTELKALNAAGKCSWSLAQGTLPAGIAFSEVGLLSGKATQAGQFPITVKVSDGTGRYQRQLALQVSEDKPPVIGELSLKAVPLDEYVFQELRSAGGVRPLKWSLAEGKLPFGMRLSEAGILLGTPGEAGDFSFTVRVSDSHPAGSHSATRAFSWSVNSSTPEALLVKKINLEGKKRDPIKVDGKPDESCWDLSAPIAKKVQGSPTKKASFGAVWAGRNKGAGEGLWLAVKVLDGPAGKTPKDAVHLFLDGRHNREVIYNADDMHVVIRRSNGKAEFLRTRTPWWFLQSAVAETGDGYIVEIKIGNAFFQGKGIEVPFTAKAVYGFDVAVDEGSQELGQQVWRGTNRNAEDTSGFGSILLTDEPVN